MPSVPAFTELTIEDTVEEGLQAISHKALDLSLTSSEQSFTAGRVILAEEDRCLRVSAIHLLEQDRYVTQLE
jgi:hypothetical protein